MSTGYTEAPNVDDRFGEILVGSTEIALAELAANVSVDLHY